MSTVVEPRVLDAWQLLPQVLEEVVLATAHDTHLGVAGRVRSMTTPLGGTPAVVGHGLHDLIATTVHTSVRWGLRAGRLGLRGAAGAGLGQALDDGPRGRFVRSAVNGLIGDRLEEEGSPLAIRMAVRHGGKDVAPDSLAEAFPAASDHVAFFLHGLCENESYWDLRREVHGTTYPDLVRQLGWTPVLLRANTGRSVRANGADLAALLRDVVAGWPVPPRRIALVGHSMGGLVIRAACGLVSEDDAWTRLVTDVVCLGTPHRGAPIAGGLRRGSGALARLPETAGFGRAIDHLSVGITDLVEGLGGEVPSLPGVRNRLVCATLAASPRHPVSRLAGDMLVGMGSAYGEGRGPGIFDGADRLHLPGADHFDLLNHPAVHRALAEWLAR